MNTLMNQIFRGRCLLLKLRISEFSKSIPLKLNGDIVESWSYTIIVILLADRSFGDILSTVAWNL